MKIGRCEIRFDENEFIEFKRESVIKSMFNQIKGLEYYNFESPNIGIMWLEPGDCIELKDSEENTYKTFYLNAKIIINTGIKGTIGSAIPKETNTEYKVTTEEQKKNLKVERLAKKHEGLIQDIIEEQTETSNKLTKHEQDINSIKDSVSQIEDLTNEVSGTTTISLENCVAGNLLELHIYGNNTVFDYLYPSDDIFPSEDLYPYGDSRIVVTDKNNNSKVYELGVREVLRQNGNVCDEYVLKEGKAQIIRRINKDGTVKSQEIIEDLGNYAIDLSEGVNTIKIQNYVAKLSAKWAIKSDYTDVFATKVEMNASIETKADQINLEVKKKVDEDEVISKINMSSEAIGIQANKIELSANDVLNLLAGNEINISSHEISIKSDVLYIDKYGNITLNSKSGTPALKIIDYSGDEVEINPNNFNMSYKYIDNIIDIFLQKGGIYIKSSNGNYINLNADLGYIEIKTNGRTKRIEGE